MTKKVFLTTLGCKVNQFESASFSSTFQEQGLVLTKSIEHADIIVINTCTVTARASGQSRQEIRKAARRNPTATVVVTGCHAQLAAAEIEACADIPKERLRIVPNDRKDKLVSQALGRNGDSGFETGPEPGATGTIHRLPVSRFSGRTRAFLKVQDGCSAFCSYCIVPLARGASRSLPPGEVLQQVRRFSQAGHREVVVTGIHIGHYGLDLPESQTITSLMELLCASFPALRFRLSSIEPLEIDEHLLTLMNDHANFMPHFHIPLQSGDDEILKNMNRRYGREQFIEVVDRCRESQPDAAIGIDVMVGFPGETEAHYANTREVIERIDCTYLHVFPYSRRPGTAAAAFPGHVDKVEKQRRVEELRRLGEKKKGRFYRRHLDTAHHVLIERERDQQGRLKGYTENYIPVALERGTGRPNSVATVLLNAIERDIVTGTIISEI